MSSDVLGLGAVYNRNYANYDAVGNRLSKQLVFNGTPIWTENYGYNNIYELTSVTGSATHSYAYDKVNNRTTVDGTTYTHNNVNQYTTVGTTTLNHDGNGNTTFDGVNTFTYDEENRIIAASNSQMSALYTFDALDRRVGKLVTPTGGVSVPSAYLYSGDQIIEQVDPTGAFQSIFIYGNGLDEPISMFYGNLYAYHEDGLGSIDAVLYWNGNVAEYNLYDVFGQPSILSSPINNLFMFTGRQWDPETGTYQYRNRQFHPGLGSFLQRDPIGYADGMNVFAYTKNNPVNFVDPWGLDTYYINNNFSSSNPTNEELFSHSFVAITSIDPVTGRETVMKTFSWVNTNHGSWEDVYKKQNILGAQKAIDTRVGAIKVGFANLDPYVESVFEIKKNQSGNYSLTGDSCHNQALDLIENAQFRLKINKIMSLR